MVPRRGRRGRRLTLISPPRTHGVLQWCRGEDAAVGVAPESRSRQGIRGQGASTCHVDARWAGMERLGYPASRFPSRFASASEPGVCDGSPSLAVWLDDDGAFAGVPADDAEGGEPGPAGVGRAQIDQGQGVLSVVEDVVEAGHEHLALGGRE